MNDPRPTAPEELANRISRLLEIYRKAEGPKWKQTVDALQCLKGQNLSGLPQRLVRHLESCLLEVNRITEAYPIETFDDYRMLRDEEHEQIRGRLEAIAFEYEP